MVTSFLLRALEQGRSRGGRSTLRRPTFSLSEDATGQGDCLVLIPIVMIFDPDATLLVMSASLGRG